MNSIETPQDHNVLVPVDFSDLSKHALFHGAKMANLFNDSITLLHILDTGGLFSFIDKTNKELLYEGTNKKLDDLIRDLNIQYPNIKINKMIKEGKPHKVIVETAENVKCDAIVMGSNGEAGIEKILGSTVSKVITGAHVPVVVVKRSPKRPEYLKIVLPIDLTKETKQKVGMAIHLAKKYNSEVHVIAESEGDEFLRNRINASMRQIENILEENGVKWISKITEGKDYPGHIGDDTIRYSEEIDADLILIMAQQETGLTDFFIGSQSQQVINRSNVPVMCILPKETYKFFGTDGFY
jgi:nucleotide-binding universal stress UspA family protein